MAVASVQALTSVGFEVTVIMPALGPLAAEFEKANAEIVVENLPVIRKALRRPWKALALLVRLPSVNRAARATLIGLRPDIVYVNTITQPWWLLAAHRLKTPSIVHVREAEANAGRFLNQLLNLPLNLATRIVCNSRSTLEHVLRFARGIRDRTRVIYNGKDWSDYLVSPFTGVSSTPKVLFLGRLNPRKGPDTAIRAVAELVRQGVDAKLIVAGSVFPGYEWFETELRELVANLGLADRCEFTGFVDDVASTIARADIVTVPSLVEPFGTVAAEGMAGMRPTVVADTQGLLEIVSDGETGLVFTAGDWKSLAACLARIIDDPALASSLAENGRRSVVARFSREQYDRQTVEVANEVLGHG
jgi:glycosyltransferase involved in cell wall biosynthesis